jgi:YD repeat-containing protein
MDQILSFIRKYMPSLLNTDRYKVAEANEAAVNGGDSIVVVISSGVQFRFITDQDQLFLDLEKIWSRRMAANRERPHRRPAQTQQRNVRLRNASRPSTRTMLDHDADSRVVARVLPTGERTETVYDEVGRVVRLDTPGVGVTRVGYDLAGRLTFSQDARYGIRRFAYDAAGQLVAATNGIGGVNRYAYDDRGRLVSITDPLVRSTDIVSGLLQGFATGGDGPVVGRWAP